MKHSAKTLQNGAALLFLAAATISAQTETARPSDSGYVLGPEDTIAVRAAEIDEYSQQNLAPLRVDPAGDVHLPLIGRIHVAGETIGEAERQVAGGLSRVAWKPDVSITVTEFASRPVSVLGAVRNPGVHQISGHKTMLEVISLAGGLSQDAGNSIRITRLAERGPLPLPGATSDASGKFLTGELNIHSVMEAKDPGVNIDVLPDDVITVPKADLVYVIGAVKKPGGFVLNEKAQVSVLQALSMAEGTEKTAAQKSARILRMSDAGKVRTEIPVDLHAILNGAAPDVGLAANDILLVPESKARSASLRALEAAVQLGTGFAIWRL